MGIKTDRLEPIEKLRERHERLNERKITAAANLRHAEEQLERLQREAVEQFGTSDLAELRRQLEAQTAENFRLCDDFAHHLDQIEQELKAVETDFASKR